MNLNNICHDIYFFNLNAKLYKIIDNIKLLFKKYGY